jgi:uncharacterized protein YndB with AHSA1/START domain
MTNMTDPLIVKNTIEINAPAAKVWDALVNPDQTKKYMFGCETVSDWEVGSPLLWQMDYEGKDFVAVKGEIVNIKPNEFLIYTVIDPNSSMPDISENYLTVAYALTEANGKTTLTVTQSGFDGAADGEKRYKDVYNNGEGWNPILLQIKALLEA